MTSASRPGGSLLPYICDEHRREFTQWELELDEGVRHFVRVLSDHGVETFQSCQGGRGHAFAEPTVQFHGTEAAGWHALGVALDHGMPVTDLQRNWRIDRALAPVGPHWELVFDSEWWWR